MNEPAETGNTDLLIDPATGEVIDLSSGTYQQRIGDLTGRIVAAQRAIKEWEAAIAVYKEAADQLLEEARFPTLTAAAGTITRQSRTTATGRPDWVERVTQKYELSTGQVRAIYECARTLDAKALTALARSGAVPASAVSDLIETKVAHFIVVTGAASAR